MSDVDPRSLIDLDECVINALELFASPQGRLPTLELDTFEKPLVVGSGNAIATGRILFSDKDAIFADESTYKDKLRAIEAIDGVFLFSASASKHAPGIAETAKQAGKPVTLFTCNPAAKALHEQGLIDEVHVFPHLPEPYTYNTSTYMGMILAETREEPRTVLEYITSVVEPAVKNFGRGLSQFDAFFLLVPERLDLIRVMLTTKFVELFGRKLARDVFTREQAKHATTVIPSDSELFISFGCENEWWGRHRLSIPLPDGAGFGAMMAIGYYVIGKIQAQKPPWFKESIVGFCKEAKKWFGKEMPVIVKYD